MSFIKLDDVTVEARQIHSDGDYVVTVSHKTFGNLYEIQVTTIPTGIDIECIDRINDLSVDINTLEDV